MKNKLIATIIFTLAIFPALIAKPLFADFDLAQELRGRIVLQVESHGEAWYISPTDFKRYYLGRPADAFDLMRQLGTGITNKNLAKIAIGLLNDNSQDDDDDGLSNSLENALKTDPLKSDSDNDGYNDKAEIENNYNPLGAGKLNIDPDFTKTNSGKIFLQIEKAGQAWYVNPSDQKRYFLGRPEDAFNIMKKLSLGITNENLNKISIGYLSALTIAPAQTQNQINYDDVIYEAANAIKSGSAATALTFFAPEALPAVKYTLNFLNSEGKYNLGNILSNAKLSSQTVSEKIYSTNIYFAGYNVKLNFRAEKQEDGKWLLTNL